MTPEEEEIQKRALALQEAEHALAQAETEYAEHRLLLKAFEQAYIMAVQEEQRELTRWEGLISHQLNRIHFLQAVQDGVEVCPSTPYEGMPLDETQPIQADAHLNAAEPQITQSESNPDIKSLYRELARRYHPDLAENAHVRGLRAAVMQEINTAYQQRDLDALIQISHRPAIVDPEQESVGDRLVWIIRRESEVGKRVQAAQDKLKASKSSPLGVLMAHCDARPKERQFDDVKRALKMQIQNLKTEWGFHCQQESELWQELL